MFKKFLSKLSIKNIVIGGLVVGLTIGGISYYSYSNKKKEMLAAEKTNVIDANIQTAADEPKEEEKVIEENSEPAAEEKPVEPSEAPSTEQSSSTNENKNVSSSGSSSKSSNTSGGSGSNQTKPVETNKPTPPPVEKPKTETPPPATEKPTEPAKPSIQVGFNQEATNKINAVNSYGGDSQGQNRQAYINACLAIAKGQDFDKTSLSTYYEGKEKLKYISHTDNVVTRNEPMSYFHDYKNPSGFNDGFKYTVAYWSGSTWKLHCITIRVA